ncbi:MAG: AAA domain-containing protein, partial [Bacilli bacterium]|nr:AAA domain-containing protein [Bacilli bacterium]
GHGPFLFSKVEHGDIANDAYRRGCLVAVSENKKSDDYLKNLARKATMTLEESGCNPLFLTLGVIRWFDNEKAAKNNSGSMFAPLFVLPIRMPKRKNTLYYSFEYSLDDLQLNTTLFQYLQHNCGVDLTDISSEHLPLDSNGVPDVRKVFNTIKKKIESKENWTIVEDISTISLFSFAHFTMWTDLKVRRDALMENPVVQSLYSGVKSWDDRDDLVDYEEMDERISPSDLAIPLPADSSQVKAISDSLMGESFILDGPPGTGKSQTIANMVVNFMNHGKSVLFVAEKEVALEVVKRRLDSLGLGDFTLMLSSANASKTKVLSKIGEMLDYGSTKSPAELDKTLEEITEKREALNLILDKLHKPNGFFVSAYESIVKYLELDSVKGNTTVDEEYASSLTSESYLNAINELESLAQKAEINGPYLANPFLGFTSRNYSLSLRDELIEEVKALAEDLRHYEIDSYNALLKTKGLFPSTRSNLKMFVAIINTLKDGRNYYKQYVGSDAFIDRYESLVALLTKSEEVFSFKEYLSTHYLEGIFELNAKELIEEWNTANSLSFFKKIGAVSKFKSKLKAYKKSKECLKDRIIQDALEKLVTIEKFNEYLESANGYDRKVYRELEIETSKSAEKALIKLAKSKDLSDLVASISFKDSESKSKFVSFIAFLSDDDSLWENKSYECLENDLIKVDESVNKLKEKYEFDINLYGDFDHYFESLSSKLQSAYINAGRLGEWVLYLNELDKARTFVPDVVVDDLISGKLNSGNLIDSYVSALSYRILSSILDKDNLGALSSSEIDQQIDKYQSLIEEMSTLIVKETAAKITANYPNTGIKYAQSSIVANLRKLAKNGGRNTTLRQIFNDEDFASLIKALCPCMFMSPLAVAQYLEPGKYQFDAVIFDEASQIPTSEAIGAIGRGKCCIIAGDEQQMPPTNFFSSNITLESEDDAFISIGEDLESLLDDVIALGLPRRRLTCHYRSKHESLIAFSNKKFYKNSLLTFPSSKDEKESVSFRFVGGEYEQKRGRNVQEAEAIVKEVLKRLKDDELSKHSIGIVTFNEAQQNLIDDLLDKEFVKKPDLNNMPGGETIFVKNLENVQGDERDVILFSITYGHDKKTGHFGLNFGPLSREKGERRLNVAVSRAREEMIVFASIEPEEIQAERAKNEGARFLRDFLLFAKYGVDAINNIYDNASMHRDVSIADFLAKDLESKGFIVETNVGASTFKVDLALREQSGEFVLGVLLDGKSYEESNTCRDRNVVQPTMLKRLGWNLIRVWSVEYFDHKEEVVSKIIAAYNNAKSRPITQDASLEQTGKIVFEKEERNVAINEIAYKRYVVQETLSVEDDYDYSTRQRISSMLQEAVEVEAPVSEKRLESIFKEILNINRFSDSTKGMFSRSLGRLDVEVEYCSGTRFYWPRDGLKDTYKFYRPVDEMTPRKIQDYSWIELGNLFNDILSVQGRLTIEDLERTALSILGFKALNATASKYLDAALRSNHHGRHNIEISDDGYVSLF